MIIAFYSHASYTGKDSCADFVAAWCRERGIACVRDAFAWDGKVVAADALGIQGTREEKVAAIDRIKNDGRGGSFNVARTMLDESGVVLDLLDE